MYDKLTKIRKENPNFDKKMVDIFADKMPKLLALRIEGEEYNMKRLQRGESLAGRFSR